jgi:hypothetical protein
MKKLLLLITIILLVACASSPQAIQTAIAKTQAAWTPVTTQTSYPTYTPQPTMMITEVVTVTFTPTSAPPVFTDVPSANLERTWIETLYRNGVTTGCSTEPLDYCPDLRVTRAQMAVFLGRALHGSMYTPPAGTKAVFADVPLSNWASDWITQLYADGITSGCQASPLSYCPDRPVTRAQAAILLLRAKHGASYAPPAMGGSTGFGDVSTSYWAAAWIKQLSAEGITSGCGGGNYCPDDPVTRAQVAKFLVLTFNLP